MILTLDLATDRIGQYVDCWSRSLMSGDYPKQIIEDDNGVLYLEHPLTKVKKEITTLDGMKNEDVDDTPFFKFDYFINGEIEEAN